MSKPIVNEAFEDASRQLCVVVVNYGSTDDIAANLGSAVLPRGAQVVVVDNFTTPEEATRCQTLCSQHGWDYVASQVNLGFGAGCNLGAKHALASGPKDLLFLNPDASITAPNIERLREAASDGAICAPRIANSSGSLWFAGGRINRWGGFAHHFDSRSSGLPIHWLTAACLWVPYEAWCALEGFDESYFLYWEDVELTVRWTVLGGTLRVAHGAQAIHDVGGTQSGTAAGKSATYVLYNLVNRGRFMRSHGSLRWRLWWAITTPIYQYRMARASARGILSSRAIAYVRANFLGAARGLRILIWR